MTQRARAATTADVVLRHWREAVPDDRLAHLVKDATRGLSRALQLRLSRYGVSYGHWVFLRILWVRDGVTQRELAHEAGMSEPTTWSALNAMEDNGYIEKRKLPHNAKNVYIFLTKAGRALEHTLVPLAEDVNRVAVEGLSLEEVSRTRKFLFAMIENLARDEAAEEDARDEKARNG